MRANSLAARFILISTIWSVVALVVAAFLLTALYKGNAERNFEELLNAHLYNLMGAVDIDENGKLTGTPNLGDPLFMQPYSGWYWSVTPQPAEDTKDRNLRSVSMVNGDLETPSSTNTPFKDGFLRSYGLSGFEGEQLFVAEAQIFLGEGDDLFRFLVAGNYNVLESEISEFSRSLIIFLAIFGLGMIAATFVIIKLGLRPLSRAKQTLNQVRRGEAERLEGTFPEEIAPLVDEMNALIDANKTVLERARTQVGNLAHALKTPLSILKNEVNSSHADLPKTVEEQTDRMQEHVQRYLDRARIAAQSGSISARTPVKPVLERMVRVMKRLYPNLEFELSEIDDQQIVFRGEQQDLEEVLGNLIENACKFARKKIAILVDFHPSSSGSTAMPVLEFNVEDDGKGLTREQRIEAVKRGKRLDESRPGSGLGLSIVDDIVNEYKGSVKLLDSPLGGLKVVVRLPAI